MSNFTLIAEGLDVAPALAELAALPDYYWLASHGSEADRLVALLGTDGQAYLRDELPAAWALVARVHGISARDFGDSGALVYARAGQLPPGHRITPHADGHDGVRYRRYQIILASGPEAELVLNGESRNLKAGEAWLIDSSKIHSAVNRDTVPRITLLFDSRVA